MILIHESTSRTKDKPYSDIIENSKLIEDESERLQYIIDFDWRLLYYTDKSDLRDEYLKLYEL